SVKIGETPGYIYLTINILYGIIRQSYSGEAFEFWLASRGTCFNSCHYNRVTYHIDNSGLIINL
ncbi:hypothetical protein KAR91_06050, partial [Candidatus Pacearchaeota archaeon]|nr:hypothetical protein [Candidatus Pacearchaeota archaeon]